jgi:hypothetical protein
MLVMCKYAGVNEIKIINPEPDPKATRATRGTSGNFELFEYACV